MSTATRYYASANIDIVRVFKPTTPPPQAAQQMPQATVEPNKATPEPNEATPKTDQPLKQQSKMLCSHLVFVFADSLAVYA